MIDDREFPDSVRAETLEELLERVRQRPPMTAQEKRAQRIDWAVGQVLCMRKYTALSQAEVDAVEWELRIGIAKHLEGML